MDSKYLFIVLLGGKESGYLFEQHKYFFCVADDFEEAKLKAKQFWKGATCLHVDSYICLEDILGHKVVIQDDCNGFPVEGIEIGKKLFFVNFGGYVEGVFTEIHKNTFVIASDEEEAKKLANQQRYFADNLLQEEHCRPHVDDVVCVDELLSSQGYSVKLERIPINDCEGLESEKQSREPKIVTTGFLRI